MKSISPFRISPSSVINNREVLFNKCFHRVQTNRNAFITRLRESRKNNDESTFIRSILLESNNTLSIDGKEHHQNQLENNCINNSHLQNDAESSDDLGNDEFVELMEKISEAIFIENCDYDDVDMLEKLSNVDIECDMECADESMICPICRLHYLKNYDHVLRCECGLQLSLQPWDPNTQELMIITTSEVKTRLGNVFDSHKDYCLKVTNGIYENGSQYRVNSLHYVLQDGKLWGCCTECGFYMNVM